MLCGMFHPKNPTGLDYPGLVGFFYVSVSLEWIRLIRVSRRDPPKSLSDFIGYYGMSL